MTDTELLSAYKRRLARERYVDPYEKQTRTCRLISSVGEDDFRFLRQIRAERGTLQTTVNLLFHKLIYALREHNITDYTRVDDFEIAVAGCKLILGGVPTRSVDGETPGPDDGRGTPRTSALLPSTPSVATDPTGGAKSRSGVRPRRAKVARAKGE